MPLSWNEIRERAIRFSKDWADASSEQAERQTFWNELFDVFGIRRKLVASFEEPVRKISGQWGFIDLFWKGTLLVEHKSRGKSLDKAESQANDYIQNLVNEGRHDEVPRYIIISDFQYLALHDLEVGTSLQFELKDFHKHINTFGFIPGYKQHKIREVEDPINIRAVELLGELHDSLEDGGYAGHDLERLLVRILFCLFAEDTGIFERNAFQMFLENHTHLDGSNLGAELSQLFDVLNRPPEKRQVNLREELAQLPYVNGELFAEFLGFPAFNRDMRNSLLRATRFDWSQISPAVFGSLFQAVMDPVERRKIGAHYTSERDILKVIEPLFLDDLKSMLQRAGNDKNKLTKLHDHLASLRLLDPACGCGNFLVIAYREMRLIELEILKRLSKGRRSLDIGTLSKIDVDQMYGIEIEEWPARIAEVAMWLMDHQMNLRLSEEFGDYFVRLPLKKSPHIRHGNALTLDWNEVLPTEQCSYVLGNPPFIGKHLLTKEQDDERQFIWEGISGTGFLDYVTCWYKKAAQYIQGSRVRVAFVSTNSITQGEQAGILWTHLLARHTIKIHFAYRTFPWESEARGKAHVHVVIVGFAAFDVEKKVVYELSDSNTVTSESARNIGPYLINSDDIALPIRKNPICRVPPIINGNKPADGGFLIVEEKERNTVLTENPEIAPWLKPFVSADEFINGRLRWVLWLQDVPPETIRRSPGVIKRIAGVRAFREKSKKLSTKQKAFSPTVFDQIRQPTSRYLLIPRHSSENRKYIPIGYFNPDVIISDSCTAIPNASLFEFGVISSLMHVSWTRLVCGRIKSDFRYSNKLVYNNFPWPQNPTDKQRFAVEAKAQIVLDIRAKYYNSSLADLYDPLTMPPDLVKSHDQLDRAVELCYRSKPFQSDRERVEYLFELYAELTTPLVANEKPKKIRKAKG